MTSDNVGRARAELQEETHRYRERVQALARELIDNGVHAPAGRLLVLDRILYSHWNEITCALAELLPPPPAEDLRPKKRGSSSKPAAAAGAAEHRHKYGPDGVCTVAGCGAKRQRAERGQGERSRPEARQSPEARTVPLPLAASARPSLRDGEEDPFADGVMGSSGVRR